MPARFFDYSFRLLILILPFMTFLSVFTEFKLGIPGVTYLKELLIISMFFCLILSLWKQKIPFVWTRYDSLIALYFVIMIIITLFTTGFVGLIYGGRYDFSFLILFLIVFHGFLLLSQPISYYIRLFLLSGGIALFLSMLLKWPLSEDILLYFGFSGNPSNWQFGGSVPIFHGVEGANVRRFQGIFDGPNTMGAFLLVYIGMLVYYFRSYKQWFFVLGIGVLLAVILIVYTYSRSAQLGFIGGVGVILLLSFPFLFKRYKLQTISLLLLSIIGISVLFILYGGAIIERSGSNKGHAERMTIGMQRFLENPLGQGLGSAGPAYRHVQDLEEKSRSEIERIDVENIPESWYIQQFIEGGFLGGILFILIMFLVFYGLFRVHVVLSGMFLSILIMNFFLHTFESSLISLSLFALIGALLGAHHLRKNHVK